MPPPEWTAILLAGGIGSRIRSLYPETPKPLIPVAGKPFIEWLMHYWIRQGVKQFVISAGYGAEAMRQFVDEWPDTSVPVVMARESEPLGTGGAILHAAQTPGCSDPFIVANGDSLIIADLAPALSTFNESKVDGLMVAVEVEDAGRFGSIETRDGDVLAGFHEKRPGHGFINAGIYMLRRRVLSQFPARTPLSVESDVFPELLRHGAVIKVFRVTAPFLDIGTPESLARADDFVKNNFPMIQPSKHESAANQLL